MQHCDEVIFSPSSTQIKKSHVNELMAKLGVKDRKELWSASVSDLEKFWDTVMEDIGIEWYEPYRQTLDRSQGIEWTKWFVGGKLNIAHNCVDRHAKSDKKNREALVWEGDGGEIRRLTYEEFSQQVNQAANALKKLGVAKGDTVGILMPMVPEVVIQLFACFKVGAVAIPIFSGFGVDAIASRLDSAKAKVLFTSDVSFRRGKKIDVKKTAEEATKALPSLKRIVFQRGETAPALEKGRDFAWKDFVLTQPTECRSEWLEAEDRALIIFTSGTTGKPKGAIHTHAGCLATIGKELRYAFNTDDKSRFFWFTDIGWMMGPWEMIGVTLFGGTLFLFEGAPDYPTPTRLWEMIERHKLTALGISPTAVRLLMKSGDEPLKKFALDSLEILGSTGEPWDPESYLWYFKNVGKGRCPVINISGGTEIIGCLLLPLPIDSLKVCSLGSPGLGVDADVFDEEGKSVRGGIGHLVCKQPLPSMTKGFLNDDARYLETYFSKWKGIWYHGDWAHVDAEGDWFLHGRSDDTIKIAGKRVGPAEFEAAILSNAKISEAAAVGVPDALKGETCVCYVVPKPSIAPSEELRKELFETVTKAMGKSLAPKSILFCRALPKTRSGKILRGIIKKLYLKESVADLSSVENPDTLSAISNAS